jgi:hypothetical protein
MVFAPNEYTVLGGKCLDIYSAFGIYRRHKQKYTEMLLIQDILVSDALLDEEFVCHLERCRGACCWKGDYGAPLEPAEIEGLAEELPALAGYLDGDAKVEIAANGLSQYYDEPAYYGTSLRNNGACVFMRLRPDGIAECTIEKAWEDGAIAMRKPISCHLYPVRVKRLPNVGFEALNYNVWSICSPACSYGRSLKIPLYQFVKEAVIRRYGQAFYDELDAIAKDRATSRSD